MPKFFRFVIVLILFLAIFPAYTWYKGEAAPIPPGVHLGGVEMSTYSTADEVLGALDMRMEEPVAVMFGDTRLLLTPETIDFQIDAEAMLAEATTYLNGPDFVEIALRQLIGLEQQRRNVPLYFTYSEENLAAWLHEVAAEYNRPPQTARVKLPQWEWQEASADPIVPAGFVGTVQEDWEWTLGAPGQVLNVTESMDIVVDAIASGTERRADLVIKEQQAPLPTMQDLSRALNSYTSDFPGFAAVYVQDIATGEEATVDVDVAFSGMSTMKVAIVIEAFRQIEGDPEPLISQWMDYAMGESSNYAANQLLTFVGGGDLFAGGRQVTEMMRALGLTNSYIQTGYDNKSVIAPIPTEANQRTDWNTNPDSHLQSTPEDMGRLLAEIYRCTLGTGALIETFGNALTPDECRMTLFYMSHNQFQELTWGGIPRPASTWLVHKHGFVNEAHSDLALVWGPNGPYVVATYLWRPGWLDWETSNGTMKEVSRIIWNYFTFQRTLDPRPLDEPPIFSLPPGYVAINAYTSLAANRLE